MSGDWKVGDLAVCVDDSPCRCCGSPWPIPCRAYRVTGTYVGKNYRTGSVMLALVLDGVDPRFGAHMTDMGLPAHRFRKIHPDDPEACETDFVDLLRLSKRKVTA